jgi:hypothetical protein
MMTITERNLVFAHVPSMRPIGDLEANGEVERLDRDPSRYIDGEFWDRGETSGRCYDRDSYWEPETRGFSGVGHPLVVC